MLKLIVIPAALAAMLPLAAAPASARQVAGPAGLQTSETPPPSGHLLPALIRARVQAAPAANDGQQDGGRATLSCRKTGGDRAATDTPDSADACAGHVKVFDGARGNSLHAADEAPDSEAARIQQPNNLKQLGLANTHP